MTDQSASVDSGTGTASNTWAPSSGPAADLAARVEERPELAIGGAFAGGVLVALILKRIAR